MSQQGGQISVYQRANSWLDLVMAKFKNNWLRLRVCSWRTTVFDLNWKKAKCKKDFPEIQNKASKPLTIKRFVWREVVFYHFHSGPMCWSLSQRVCGRHQTKAPLERTLDQLQNLATLLVHEDWRYTVGGRDLDRQDHAFATMLKPQHRGAKFKKPQHAGHYQRVLPAMVMNYMTGGGRVKWMGEKAEKPQYETHGDP